MRVSVRRLAREWALKVLYQYDIGNGDLREVLLEAMDHLRRDFVHLGSRTSSGSPYEEVCLETLTKPLLPVLHQLHPPLVRLLVFASTALLGEAPWWQEQWLERALRNRVPASALQPPYLLSPLPRAAFFPPTGHPLEEDLQRLSPQDRAILDSFIDEAREGINGKMSLPAALEPTLRAVARQAAKQMTADISPHLAPAEVAHLLLERREEFHRQQIALWRRIAETVKTHMELWLRTGPFAAQLVLDVSENRTRIDAAIEDTATGWRLDRLVSVDRNILRIATCELLIRQELPAAIIINEAVELGKKYSTADSGRFINGVLSAMAEKLMAQPQPAPHLLEQEETLIEIETNGKDES